MAKSLALIFLGEKKLVVFVRKEIVL